MEKDLISRITTPDYITVKLKHPNGSVNFNRPLFIIIKKDGTIYDNKAYTNKEHAMRIFDVIEDSDAYDDNEVCLHMIWLPFIGRTVSYIYESEFTVPNDTSTIDILEAQEYYRRKIFACEEHAKKSEIMKAIYNKVGNSGVSIQHIRVIKN